MILCIKVSFLIKSLRMKEKYLSLISACKLYKINAHKYIEKGSKGQRTLILFCWHTLSFEAIKSFHLITSESGTKI